MVASDETDPGSPGASHRKSEGGSDPEGVGANHEDDVIFWRERALRLAESNEAGTSAVMERRRPGAAAAALDALLHPIAGDDGGYDGPPTATGTSAPHSGARGGVLLDRESRRTADPGGVSTATKKRRAAAHAAVASLHAVAADLAEVAEALDLELVALAEGTVETHARETRALDERARRAAAPLRRRRDTVERLVEHIEQILEGTVGTDFDTDDKAAQLIKNEAVRLRRCRDDVARDAFAFGENERAKSAYTNEKDAFLFEKPKQKRQPARGRPGKPPKARSSSPETRRRSLSSDTHPEPHTLRNPPWDARIAVDTSRDDAARTERSRSPSRSRSNSRGRSKDAGDVYDTKQHTHAFGEAYAANVANAANLTQGASEHARTYNPVDDAAFTAEALETRAQRAVQLAAEARAKATVLAGKLPWYQGDVHPRTVFRPPNPGTNGDDFTSALWPDFDAYGGGVDTCETAPDGNENDVSRTERLRRGYQTALLEMQRRNAVEREAAGAAAEAAACELEMQRTQLAQIASRLAKAAGVPSALGNRAGSISRAADAGAFAFAAERKKANGFGQGLPVAASAALEESNARDRAARRERLFDDTAQRKREGVSSTASAMAHLAEIARVTGERMLRVSFAGGDCSAKSPLKTTALDAVATAAVHAAAAADASSAGASPLVIAAALSEMASALKLAERAAAGVDAAARADEARLTKAEAMLASTAEALEDEVRSSVGEFDTVLEQLKVCRDRAEDCMDHDGDANGDDFILETVLRKAESGASFDAQASLAAAAIRGSFYGRVDSRDENSRFQVVTSAHPKPQSRSPNRSPKKRQLGDRCPPDAKRPSSIGFGGGQKFGAPDFDFGDEKKENENAEATAMEIVGPAAFALNKFGTLTFVG